MRGVSLLSVVACFLIAQPSGATTTQMRNVLVLYSNNRLVPGNIEVDRGLRSALANTPERPVQIFSEFLDRPDFGGEDYENAVTTYLREKYAERPPDAVIAVSNEAFEFLLRHRARLFQNIPVVHTAVATSFLRPLLPLPTDVIGVPRDYDFIGTIRQALLWHPSARRLVIVTGSSERDRDWETLIRRELASSPVSVAVEFLAGLPTAALLEQLAKLDAESVIFTPGYFEDGSGVLFSPREAVSLLAPAANAPVYGPFNTFIGTGVVGGRMPAFEDMGAQAGQIVNALLSGAAPASLKLPAVTPTSLRADWRQVRRWGINPEKIPTDTVVYFREATFWETYHNVIVVSAVIILLQGALILTLLLERGRRRAAEVAVQRQHAELAHASRLAMAGELTASIAHEINQPLGAILASVDAADLMLQSGEDRREDLRRIVTRIRKDDLRASEVISGLRKLLAKHEPERKTFDLRAAVADAVALLSAEAQHRDVVIEQRSGPLPVRVVGDPTQIQQVLINLILNALDAIADLPPSRRTVIVSVLHADDRVLVTVSDRGRGIASEDLPQLFESFFSTKQEGMGLGLSIARSIVEAHGGRLWAENQDGGGALFSIELPDADAPWSHSKGAA